MTTLAEQFSAATKAGIEAQIAMINQFASKTFEGVEKLVDLNLNAAKSSLEETHEAAQQLLTARDAQEFLMLTGAQAQPNVEKGLAYGRYLAGIVSSTQAEWTKTAEAQLAEINRQMISLIDDVSKNAPAGSETAISFFKTTIGNFNAGCEQLSRSAQQAAQTMELNVSAAADQLTPATVKTTTRGSKK